MRDGDQSPLRKSSAGRRETSFFLHIPRTGGTTLARALVRRFGSQRIWDFNDADPAATIQEYRDLSAHRRAEIVLVHGHFSYGAHEALGDLGSYFTCLRDPIDRVASMYSYYRAQPDHRHHQAALETGIAKFVAEGDDNEARNGQARILAGLYGSPEEVDMQGQLEHARANLHKIHVLGITEEFDAFAVAVSRSFGWPHLYGWRANVARRASVVKLTDNDRDTIAEHNQADLALYAEAVERIATLNDSDPSFAREVSRYRIANKVLGWSAGVARGPQSYG